MRSGRLCKSAQGDCKIQCWSLYDKNGTLIASNDDWGTDPNASHVQAYGLAPSDLRESALARTLTAGPYTCVVRGVNNTVGTGRVEMYDLSQPPRPTVANMSVRSLIAGGSVLVGDVTVTGRANQTVLFRAIGPDLISQGVAFAMRNPTLALYDDNWNFIAGNVYWKSDQQAQIESTGLEPGDDRDAAILMNCSRDSITLLSRAGTAQSASPSWKPTRWYDRSFCKPRF